MKPTPAKFRKASLLAKTLVGSWRDGEQQPLQVSAADLNEVTPLLTSSGAAALAWWRVKNSELRDTASAQVLRQIYRLQQLQASIAEEKVEKVFRVLRRHSVDAFLAKGWAAGKMYPDQGLRPSGDIDLCIRPSHRKIVDQVLGDPELIDCSIDLHTRFSELSDRSFDELLTRAKTLNINSTEVRVLSDEDHLALLSIHFLKHAGWRPLWLCDVSVALESTSASFDWDRCLGKNKTRAHWMLCTFALAERLLDADSSRCPKQVNADELPSWFVDSIFAAWCNPNALDQPPLTHPIPMSQLLRAPRLLPAGLRQRWPNPILATVSVNGQFNSFPRFPYQVANWLARIKHLAAGEEF